jgi:hypothetical protein
MKGKRRGSSARARPVPGNVRRTSHPDVATTGKIDFSDIPELSKKQLGAMRRAGRPPVGDATKIPIAFRINPNLLARIRARAATLGRPYQTLMHEMLEKAASFRPRK